MLEQFFEFYTTLYQLEIAPVSVKPAGWVIAGILALGCGLLYYCARLARRPVPFLFWLSAILLSVQLAFLEIGAIIVTVCWLAQSSRFHLEPYFMTIPLALAGLANIAIVLNVFPAIFRCVQGGKRPFVNRKKTARFIEVNAAIVGIVTFIAAVICSVLSA